MNCGNLNPQIMIRHNQLRSFLPTYFLAANNSPPVYFIRMAIQAYIDESYDNDGAFVMAGYIASAESWATFSKEWAEMLPKSGVRNKHGVYRFKMSEIASLHDGMTRAAAFFPIIEKHVLGMVSMKIEKSDLRRAQARIMVPGKTLDWGKFADPYFITFWSFLGKFHQFRNKMTEAFPLDEKIDFYFDNHTHAKRIILMWDKFVQTSGDEVKDYYGITPRFENDEEFLPLQAADFWAWWVRKWYKEGTPEKIQRPPNDGVFRRTTTRKFLRIQILFDEDALVEVFKVMVRREIGPDHPIYDMKVSYPTRLLLLPLLLAVVVLVLLTH